MAKLLGSTIQGGCPPVCAKELNKIRFAKARAFITPLSKIIAMGLATSKRRKTPLGRAMSQILQSCMEGEYPNIQVNPAKVLLSIGPVWRLGDVEVAINGAKITLQWNMPSSEILHPYYADDHVLLCAYNPQLGLACINEQKVVRSDKELELELSGGLQNEKVHLYLLVHTWDKKKFSNSQYLGEYL